MATNVSDPNETPEATRAAYKVILAADIGTTYTKVAWTRTKCLESPASLFIDGQWEDQRQVPTAVLYKPTQHQSPPWEFDSFGHDAIGKYTNEEQSWAEGWALFRKFKMELHKAKVGMVSSCNCRLPRLAVRVAHSSQCHQIAVFHH